MLKLDRQEQTRQRYKRIKHDYRPALEIYKSIADELVDSETLLLDAGCGEANLTDDYMGVAQMVAGVDRYLQPIRKTIEITPVVEANLAQIPFADETFSFVMNSWVMEHLQAPGGVFREIARVLKPEGYFLFITPNAYNYLIQARRLIPNRISTPIVDAIYDRGEDYIFPTHYRANTRRSIDHYLKTLQMHCVCFEYVSDPSYIAFNEIFFWLSVMIERMIDVVWPEGKVHMVGLYQKVS